LAENRTDMMKFKGVSAAIVVGLSMVGLCESAFSLGFGRPTSRAVLGETLSLTVPLHLEAGEVIADECVAADVYFGDDKQTSLSVKATVLPGEGSQRAVRVMTTSLINEPVVTVYLGAGCKAKITRKFVAFADPPGLAIGADSTVADNARGVSSPVVGDGMPLTGASAAVGERTAASTRSSRTGTTTPRPAKVPPARKPRDAAGDGVITEGPATSLASAATPLKVSPDRRSSAPAKAAAGEPARRETSRLVLDPAEVDALVIPNLMMSSAMSGVAADIDAPEVKARRAAAAALWAAMNSSPEQLARDRQRMQELEQRLAHLQQESNGAQSRVAAMEARVREAEDQRLRHPLVYALLALTVLLAFAVVWLAMRRRSQPAEAAQSWWQGEPGDGGAPQVEGAQAAEPAPSMAEPAIARTAAEFMPVRPAGTPSSAPLADTAVPAAAATVAAATAIANESTTSSRAMLIKPAAQEAREITVEELIDLEQQAEFFVVLGQDDAAIELLEGHVQSTAGASPLPHLKLLEIYQRLGRRDDYERVREAFNGRFNAYAPSWESDLQHGHALEDYPGVIDRLQNLWSVPAKAMDVLEVSLTRADGSAETFDLPAYRELLFLYGVARDLSEREAQDRTPVDLLLPVQGADADEADDISPPTLLQPLMATRPVKALPEVTPSLSLDLSLDDPAPPGGDGGARVDMDDAGKDKPEGDVGNSIDFEHVDLPQNKG
jgi:hypothetical protein